MILAGWPKNSTVWTEQESVVSFIEGDFTSMFLFVDLLTVCTAVSMPKSSKTHNEN